MGSNLAPRLSLYLPNFAQDDPGGWDHLLDLARTADEVGIDRLAISDHVVFGEDLDAYGNPKLGGAEGAKQPTGPDGHWLEPMVLLSVLAGVTKRTRLMTAILLAGLRRPVVLAKEAATLDVLSGGRLDLGVGVGWQREEYEAAGLSFEQRGRLLDHTLEVCQALWTTSPTSYDSPELSFDRIHLMPKPVSPGGVPVWVSGTVNERVARRLARFGAGWIPWGPAAADPVAGVAQMREALRAVGHSGDGLEVAGAIPLVVGDPGEVDLEATMASVPVQAEAGVTDFRLRGRIPSGRAEAADLLGSLVEAFRSTVGRTGS